MDANASDDTVLLARIAGGDRAAFGVMLERHLEPLVKFAVRYTGNFADAEDVAQETFARVWSHAPHWREQGATPRAWLYRIAYTRCVDLLRRRTPHVPMSETEPEAEPLSVARADPMEHLVHDRGMRQLVAAMGQLPERQYTALNLCAYEGLSNKEAAAVMGLSVDALESLLARGRRRLRTLLREKDPSEQTS